MFVGEGAITKRGFQRRSSSSLMVACTTLPRILKSIRYAFDWYTVATAITARGSRTRSCTRLTVTSISTSPFPTPPRLTAPYLDTHGNCSCNCSCPASDKQPLNGMPGKRLSERIASDRRGCETIPLCAKMDRKGWNGFVEASLSLLIYINAIFTIYDYDIAKKIALVTVFVLYELNVKMK